MGFLFPLFLIAGLSLIIPVLIHLFNLRRYKHVYFSNIRFLKQLQLSSKRMAAIRKKALLVTRLLFLAALVLAFSQPVLKEHGGIPEASALHIIYLDNSPSMLIQEGQQNLFERARDKAKMLIRSLPEQVRLAVITNEGGSGARFLSKQEAMELIDETVESGKPADLPTILGRVNLQAEDVSRIKVYLFSDFQETSFAGRPGMFQSDREMEFYCLPFESSLQQNLFFDTVFLNSLQLGSQQPVELLLRLKKAAAGPIPEQQVRLYVNGGLKGGFELKEQEDSLFTDTLSFQPSGRAWEKLELTISGEQADFDDTFRIALKVQASFQVLISGGQAADPYIQTAFSAFPGFSTRFGSFPTLEETGLEGASLLILQEAERLSPTQISAIKTWLDNGRHVLLFPGKSSDKSELNQALAKIAPISFGSVDTGLQEVVKLEPNHPLVYDMFERIPENVSLPSTRLRFPIQAGFAAAEQVLMRFRDGNPFIAQYQFAKGKLFICASPLGTVYSDFPLSYFFAPLLYKMAMPSGDGSVFVTRTGEKSPLWVSSRHFDSRAVWHAVGDQDAFVPLQRLSGAGVDIFLGDMARLPGFYKLYQDGNQDTFLVGVNGNRRESYLKSVSKDKLSEILQPAVVQWTDPSDINISKLASGKASFPWWKVAVIVALLAVALETLILLNPRQFGKKRTSPPFP